MRKTGLVRLAALLLALAGAACDGDPKGVSDLVVASSSATSVTLRWTQVDDGSGASASYLVGLGTPTILWATAAPTAVELSGTRIGEPLTHSFEALSPGSNYEFQLASFKRTSSGGLSNGTLSNIATASTVADAPARVSDLSVQSVTATSVTLQWTEVDNGAGGPSNYGLVSGTPTVNFATAFPSAVEVLGALVGGERSYTVSGLIAGTSYQFQLVSLRGRLATAPIVGPISDVVTGATSVASAVMPFFADDFDNGVRTPANGFTWGPTSSRTKVSNVRSLSGAYALDFRYGPDAVGGDSDAEQRFDMGRNLSEVWIEYQLFVPANFVHRDEAPDNNKLFMIWRVNYGSGSGTWQAGYEYETNADTTPNSLIRPMSSGETQSFVTDQGLNHPQYHKPFIGGTGPLQPGGWRRIRLQFKAASAGGAQDGILRMWIGNTLYAAKTTGRFRNLNNTPLDVVLRNGYFMGYSNSGFAAETVFYIDDVKFYDTDPGWPPI